MISYDHRKQTGYDLMRIVGIEYDRKMEVRS